MHQFLEGEDAGPHKKAWGGETLNARSHGESFLTVLRYRFEDIGVYFLDEPESALSFHSCLGLVSLLDMMRRERSQVIGATRSPLVASLPGATLLELGEQGIRRAASFRRPLTGTELAPFPRRSAPLPPASDSVR